MKRISKNLLLALIILSVPFAMASGQDKEKKSERKIKIVVDEGSGEKTVLDTVIIGTSMVKTIELKDGKIIYIGKPETGYKFKTDGGKVIVSVKVDEDGETQEEENIYIVSATDNHTEWVSDDGKVVKKSIIMKKDGNKSFNIIMESDDDDSDETKYIIAKDGVVVTVESDDEEKAKEIIEFRKQTLIPIRLSCSFPIKFMPYLVFRKWRRNYDLLILHRVNKFQFACHKTYTAIRIRPGKAVFQIASDRASDLCKLSPDLVMTTCMKLYFKSIITA